MKRAVRLGALLGLLVGTLALVWFDQQFALLETLPTIEAEDRGLGLGLLGVAVSLPWSLLHMTLGGPGALVSGGMLLNGALAGAAVGALTSAITHRRRTPV